MNDYTFNRHPRKNRRRERPGSRTRRALTRRANIQYDFYEGVLDAQDAEVPLPSDNVRPYLLLYRNFDRSWQHWKARQAEEKALIQSEHERLQFEVGDVATLIPDDAIRAVVLSLFGDIDYIDP